MKSIIKKIFFIVLLSASSGSLWAVSFPDSGYDNLYTEETIFSQNDSTAMMLHLLGADDDMGDPPDGNLPVPGNTPIGGALFPLFFLAFLYGVYSFRKKEKH